MLNLPSQPGAAGFVMLVTGAVAGLLVLALLHKRIAEQLGSERGEQSVTWLLTALLAATVAAGPFTLWRVIQDIRETAPITAEHAAFVGAETKLIDGELVEQIAGRIPEDASYGVVVAPQAYVEIRTSLAHWLGYALIPRRQVRLPREAEWVVVWGAPPARLGVHAVRTYLVGKNRLYKNEPVYVAELPS
jgi:hypothetical protein